GEVPLIAIGGINAENAAEVIRAGADGVAVASAVLLDDGPQEAARELKRKIQNERRAGA
ncbi:MAG: thiamine phosphate synthase, partial [Candidatus Abyssubacteria bacterium]|nr:thiamine phosphate synthase [Candidatus Abyssubacteria bacterium]